MVGIDPICSVLIGHAGGNVIINLVASSGNLYEMFVEWLCVIVYHVVPVGRFPRDIREIHVIHIADRLRWVLFVCIQVAGNLGQSSQFAPCPSDIGLLQDIDIFFAVHENPRSFERLAESETAGIPETRFFAFAFLGRDQDDSV